MGYRNLLRAKASKTSNLLSLNTGGVTLQGTPVDVNGEDDVIAAIRPDDFDVSPTGPLAVTVSSAQYHGHDFYCSGKSADGTEIYFRTKNKVQKGDKINLAA